MDISDLSIVVSYISTDHVRYCFAFGDLAEIDAIKIADLVIYFQAIELVKEKCKRIFRQLKNEKYDLKYELLRRPIHTKFRTPYEET